jgi:hypothetical protein
MTVIKTMQVGGLELRKTEDGWQYLSEGYQGDPDVWCPVQGHLGPFSGSGIEGLLDELAQAKAEVQQERIHLTHEALDDVDAGRVIDHQAVQTWAASLSSSTPLPTPK